MVAVSHAGCTPGECERPRLQSMGLELLGFAVLLAQRFVECMRPFPGCFSIGRGVETENHRSKKN
jgi:hypothetical protein